MGVCWRLQSRHEASKHQNSTSTQPASRMYSKLITSAATIILLLCLVETGSGIKCHICNSYDSYHCGDPFYYPDKPKTDKFLQECGTDQQYTFCRKIYQKVRGDVRIIRGCGYIKDEKNRTCYTTVLEEYNTEVCSCDTDGCNSASMYQLSAALVSAVCLAFSSTRSAGQSNSPHS